MNLKPLLVSATDAQGYSVSAPTPGTFPDRRCPASQRRRRPAWLPRSAFARSTGLRIQRLPRGFRVQFASRGDRLLPPARVAGDSAAAQLVRRPFCRKSFVPQENLQLLDWTQIPARSRANNPAPPP